MTSNPRDRRVPGRTLGRISTIEGYRRSSSHNPTTDQENTMSESATTYNDDRPGCMRVHIAAERSRLAGSRYSRNTLRAHARARGLRLGSLRKSDIGWHMAQHGLIDADGNLRDGFPEATR